MLGVPLWLCARGIFALGTCALGTFARGIFARVYRNRALRQRHGDIPLRVLRPGKARWPRGHDRDWATAHPDHVAALALRQVRPDAQTGDDQEASSINGVSILRGADGDEILPLLRDGPSGFRVGREIRFRVSEVTRWLDGLHEEESHFAGLGAHR